jgi:hypothetical protein
VTDTAAAAVGTFLTAVANPANLDDAQQHVLYAVHRAHQAQHDYPLARQFAPGPLAFLRERNLVIVVSFGSARRVVLPTWQGKDLAQSMWPDGEAVP